MMLFCETQSCARLWTITELIDEFNETEGLVDRLLVICVTKGCLACLTRKKTESCSPQEFGLAGCVALRLVQLCRAPLKRAQTQPPSEPLTGNHATQVVGRVGSSQKNFATKNWSKVREKTHTTGSMYCAIIGQLRQNFKNPSNSVRFLKFVVSVKGVLHKNATK